MLSSGAIKNDNARNGITPCANIMGMGINNKVGNGKWREREC